MKLFVWQDIVKEDYAGGMVYAIAPDLAQARAAVKAELATYENRKTELINSHDTLDTLEDFDKIEPTVHELTSPLVGGYTWCS